MNREVLRKQFSALLMNTNNENHLKCNIIINEDEAMGLSTSQMIKVTSIFQDPIEGIICFCTEGNYIIEFDDMEINDLVNILNELKEL